MSRVARLLTVKLSTDHSRRANERHGPEISRANCKCDTPSRYSKLGASSSTNRPTITGRKAALLHWWPARPDASLWVAAENSLTTHLVLGDPFAMRCSRTAEELTLLLLRPNIPSNGQSLPTRWRDNLPLQNLTEDWRRRHGSGVRGRRLEAGSPCRFEVPAR